MLVQYHTGELISPKIHCGHGISIWFLLCLKELWIDKTGASLSTPSKSTTKLRRRLRQSRITSTSKQGSMLSFPLRAIYFCVSAQRPQGSKAIRVLCLRSNVSRQRRSIQFHEWRREAVPRTQEVSACRGPRQPIWECCLTCVRRDGGKYGKQEKRVMERRTGDLYRWRSAGRRCRTADPRTARD